MSTFDNFLDSFKDCFFNYTAEIKGRSGGFNSVDGTYSNVYTSKISGVAVSLWQNSANNSYKGERMTANVDSIAIIKYDDLNGIELLDTDIIELNNGDVYSFVNADNVEGFNEMYEIGLKKYENG